MAKKTDPEITKRKVTMKSTVLVGENEEGQNLYQDFYAADYVKPEELEAYVADAKTRWQLVTVSEEPDAGPAGYHGQTVLMDGTVLEATKG